MSYIKNARKYPYLTDLINNGGGLSMEYIVEMKITAVAFDEGGVIWEGKRSYDSIEALLDDAEAGIKKNGLIRIADASITLRLQN